MASPPSDDAWTRRLQLLRLLIQRGRITTAEAARHTGSGRVRARRDLRALEEHGVPLRVEGQHRSRRYVLPGSWRTLGLTVDVADRLALSVGRELVSSFLHDTEVGEHLDSLGHQIAALDPDATTDSLDRRFLYIHEPAKDYAAHRQTVAAVVGAILACHPISFDYTAPNRPTRPKAFVEPLTLVVYKRGLYVGHLRRDGIRTLAVERMANVHVHSDRHFEYPRRGEYDPGALLRDRFGLFPHTEPVQRIVLRFAPAIRPFVDGRQWAPEQHLAPTPDGGCELTFAATGRELVAFVLQFGDKVQVVTPTWLRDAVIHELRHALARYTAATTATELTNSDAVGAHVDAKTCPDGLPT